MTKQENFFEDVYEVVKLIPTGRVTSYGIIGEYLGAKRSARMVGWAMNNCHAGGDIPAHRVVNSKGVLTGSHHFGGNKMQELLENEGVLVKKNQIIDFKKYFWNPSEELL